jgi:hypothetical protein
MKRIIFGLLAAAILMISSCAQENAGNPGGAWVFKSVTYNPLSCRADSSRLISTNGANSMTLVFNNNTGSLPAANGDYTVVSTTPAPGQVQVKASVGTAQYISTGGNGAQSVNVTVSNLNSRITVSGSAIQLLNTTTATDSGKLTFTVNQMP